MHEIGMWDGNIFKTSLNQSASNVRHVEKSVLKSHLDLCGVQKEKNFKCQWPGCNKAFTRNQALQDHFAFDCQRRGAGIKRAAKPVELPSKKPKTMVPYEEKVAFDGASVDATFYP